MSSGRGRWNECARFQVLRSTRVEPSGADVRLDTIPVLALQPRLTRVIAQHDTALGCRDRRRVRVAAERIRTFEVELAHPCTLR